LIKIKNQGGFRIMKIKSIILVLVVVLLFSQGLCLNAQEQEEYLTWLDGNDYLEIPEEIRIIYVGGLVDMFWYITCYDQPEFYKNIEAKMKDMSLIQIRKIFDKYLEGHPEYLHQAAASSFNYAISELIPD
jgi:hypothetical protein